MLPEPYTHRSLNKMFYFILLISIIRNTRVPEALRAQLQFNFLYVQLTFSPLKRGIMLVVKQDSCSAILVVTIL